MARHARLAPAAGAEAGAGGHDTYVRRARAEPARCFVHLSAAFIHSWPLSWLAPRTWKKEPSGLSHPYTRNGRACLAVPVVRLVPSYSYPDPGQTETPPEQRNPGLSPYQPTRAHRHDLASLYGIESLCLAALWRGEVETLPHRRRGERLSRWISAPVAIVLTVTAASEATRATSVVVSVVIAVAVTALVVR